MQECLRELLRDRYVRSPSAFLNDSTFTPPLLPTGVVVSFVYFKTTEHTMSLTCQNTGVHHVGLHAKDPAASAEFATFSAWRLSAAARRTTR